ANDFQLSDMLTGYAALELNDVTEVGFWITSRRDSWGHALTFTKFLAYDKPTSVVAGTTVIEFKGTDVAQGMGGTSRQEVQSTENNMNIRTVAYNDTLPLFNTSYTQGRIAGGAKRKYAISSTASNASVLQLQAANESWSPASVVAYVDNADNYSEQTLIYLWPKKLFMNGATGQTVRFDNSDQSKLSLTLDAGGDQNSRHLRFVIKQGNTYYMSEADFNNGTGVVELSQFNNSSVEGKRWAAFDPSTLTFPSSPVYQAVDFNNVTSVGLIYFSSRPSWGHSFTLYSFKADAIVTTAAARSVSEDLFGESMILDASFEQLPSEIRYYPNPVTNYLTIDAGEVPSLVEVYNMNGMMVKRVENANQIDLSTLSTGIYQLKVTTEKETSVFTIQKR
ncbi:MAG: T9SS type A sorting domain-containing protein, partial [Bacteroidales bacterium]|nr:T9SS type A sorting domain-containing protein [Bacteroidales bacterium]